MQVLQQGVEAASGLGDAAAHRSRGLSRYSLTVRLLVASWGRTEGNGGAGDGGVSSPTYNRKKFLTGWDQA